MTTTPVYRTGFFAPCAKLLTIARRDLAAFFSTWMGYVIVAAALLLEGLLFNAFAVGAQPKYSADVLADYFYFASGISMVAGVFLAMRAIAEERQTGTLLLFFTSPVSERQVIYGKFLSALVFLCCLHALSLYLPGLIFLNGKVSLGHIAAGYLNLVLIGGAAIAMVLFASSIAPNQIVAGVLGAAILVAMLVMWLLADVVDAPFKEIYSYLAVHNRHFHPFSKGIVHTRDVIYYLSVIVFFCECAVRALQAKRSHG